MSDEVVTTTGASDGGVGSTSGGGDAPAPPSAVSSAGPGVSAIGHTEPELSDDNGKEADPSKPKPTKHKVRRLGQEVELSLDELLAAASDDHRYELEIGKGTDGNKLTKALTLPEMLRSARLGEAAFSKMEEAANLKKAYEQARERGRQEPDWYMREHLGVEDPEDWAVQRASQRLKRDAELQELLQSNPAEYHKQVSADLQAKMDREATAKEAAQKREQAMQAAQARQQALAKEVPEALKVVGLPNSPEIQFRLGAIMRKYQSVGHNLSLDEAAQMAAESYKQEILGYLSQREPAALLSLLGHDLRKVLRGAELKALKGAEKKKEEQAAKRKEVQSIPTDRATRKKSWLEG